MLTYNKKHKLFIWKGSFADRHIPFEAGFQWHEKARAWITADRYVAFRLCQATPYLSGWECSEEVWIELTPIIDSIRSSRASEEGNFQPSAPLGQTYLPFQKAGIEHMVNQLLFYRDYVMCADEQGLGKTIEAIGVANFFGYKKLLVICPALARLNWKIELEKWHIGNPGVNVILKGTDIHKRRYTNVVSYDLASISKLAIDFMGEDCRPDMIIVDEAHYLKNRSTIRSKVVLGTPEGWINVKNRPSGDLEVSRKVKQLAKPGLASGAPVIFLTGTPVPNRPSEFWNILRWTAPDIINHWNQFQFEFRFVEKIYGNYDEVVKTKPKRSKELSIRLRGSGYMLRRLKKDVLKDLPPKRYKMVIFPPTGKTAKILVKENNFSAEEIINHGVPVGSGLPAIRREMGLAKVLQSVEYIKNLLEEAPHNKFVIFAHHIEVILEMEERLAVFSPVVIRGATSPKKRQEAIEKFQNDQETRLLIGQITAAGVAITLTRAHDVVFVESSWVPGKNSQCMDRCHRIGQTERVLVHYLVVAESLCAKILGSAAFKEKDIKEVVD